MCLHSGSIPAGFHHPGDPRYRPGSGADTCDRGFRTSLIYDMLLVRSTLSLADLRPLLVRSTPATYARTLAASSELELVAPEVARVALKLLMLREELARLVVAEAEQHAPWTPAACHRRSEHKHRRLHTETVVTLKPLCPCSLPSKIARWSIQLDCSFVR